MTIPTLRSTSYRADVAVYLSFLLLLWGIIVGCLTFEKYRIEMSSSQSYSLGSLIHSHGYSPSDMLGQSPSELPLLMDRLYRGREVILHDQSLFRPETLGQSIQMKAGGAPQVSPQLAEAWVPYAHRTMLYNPFTFSPLAKLGETLPRSTWPTHIVLLPSTEARSESNRVRTTEIEGRVFFIPEEWLQRSVPTQGGELFERLQEPLIVALFCLVGWAVIRWANGERKEYGVSLAGALPVGLTLWSATYWAARGLLGRTIVLHDLGSLLTVFVLIPVTLTLLSGSLRAHLKRSGVLIVSLAILYFLLSLLVIRSGSLVVTFDSFRLLNFENSPRDSLLSGFPIILASINALGAVTGGGIFLSFLPLLFLSLCALIVVAFYRFRHTYPSNRSAAAIGILLLLMMFGLAPMSGLQFVYVNGHVLFSCLSFLLLLHVVDSRFSEFNTTHRTGLPLFVFFLALSICMTRVEGPLLLVCLLIVLLFSGLREGPQRSRTLLPAIAGAVFLWGLGCAFLSSMGAFVSSSQFLSLGLLAILLGCISFIPESFAIKRRFHTLGFRLMMLGCFIVLYAVHTLAPSHMLESTSSVVQNLLLPSEGWGYTWWFILGIGLALEVGSRPITTVPSVDALRDAGTLQLRRALLALLLVMCSAVIAIGLFRIPYRVHWSDSANRIVFQMLPFATLWLYLGFGMRIRARGDSRRTENPLVHG